MNRFVVVLVEGYEGECRVPHPIETELSREELIEQARAYFDGLTKAGTASWERMKASEASPLDLGGSGLEIPYHEIARGVMVGVGGKEFFTTAEPDEFRTPEILTVDEWFALGPYNESEVENPFYRVLTET